MEQGLIHIYCGDGKGKTTCAVGADDPVCGTGRKSTVLPVPEGR